MYMESCPQCNVRQKIEHSRFLLLDEARAYCPKCRISTAWFYGMWASSTAEQAKEAWNVYVSNENAEKEGL